MDKSRHAKTSTVGIGTPHRENKNPTLAPNQMFLNDDAANTQVDAVKSEVKDLSTRLETRDKERKEQVGQVVW